MAFNINQFKSELVGGGARPTLFEVQITNPVVRVLTSKCLSWFAQQEFLSQRLVVT